MVPPISLSWFAGDHARLSLYSGWHNKALDKLLILPQILVFISPKWGLRERNWNFLPRGANGNMSKTSPKTSACGGLVSTAQGSGFWREAGAEPRVSLPLLLLISWYAFVHGRHVRETGRIVFKASWGLCLGKQGMRVGVSASTFLPTSSGMTTCNAMPARSARAWPCS